MKKGFSLTEILVSIAIIGILSGIGIQAFVASRERARLEEDVAKVVQAIRKAQNSALAPSRSTASGILNDQKICSIVLRINKTNKTLTSFYTIVGINGCSGIDSSRTYAAGDELNYSNIDGSTENIDFAFEVPFAETAQQTVTLTRGDASNRISKTITVTEKGLIKVEEQI
jgi:prepilin-type N-terminal cleavage/methylation domain-containing protein